MAYGSSVRCSMRFLRVLLIVGLAHTILASPKARADDSAECTGIVVDENGVRIAAAQVTLFDASGRTHRAETDPAGRFVLHGLAPGEYKADVHKEGFFSLTGQLLTLHAGANE